MKTLEIFNSLTDYMEVRIKGCADIIHDKHWRESGSMVDYDLWIMVDGEIEIHVEDKKYIVKEQDLFFLSPQLFYTARCNTDTCHFIYVHFDFKIGNNFRALDEFSLEGLISDSVDNKERKAFVESYWAYKKKEELSAFILKGYFTVLLSKVIVFQYEKNKYLTMGNHHKPKPLVRVQPVLNYIADHLGETIYTKEMAEMMGLTEKYFIVFFKEIVGTTPGRYILQAKMNKALNYIYERKLSIKEIAYNLGYPDPYTFSKAFKKNYGVAPSKIRT